MKTNPVSQRMFALIVLYDMQTTYFASVIDGISDPDAHKRLDTKANHIAWLAGSLVHQRFEIANELGVDLQPPHDDLFKNGKGIQDGLTYPSLVDYKKDWDQITPLLRDALMQVSDERLDQLFEMPGMSFPIFDLVAFSIYREANMIGQIALWRRLLGYEAMKYM